MSATIVGDISSGMITETSYEVSQDGLTTYTQKTLYNPSASVATPSLTKSISIGGASLRLVSATSSIRSGQFKELVEIFQGKSGTTLQQNATNSTAEEPIETNRNFLVSQDQAQSIVALAGGALTQGESINATTGGAVFDENGRFLYFNKNAKYNLFGVASYLNPNLTYRRGFTTTTTPNLSAVGRIVTPASDFPTTVPSGTWLCTSIEYVQRGGTFQVTQDFRSSDQKGWNPYIYGPATSPPSSS